ncbi:MAG TPA: rhodanese-like domain-containing protein [Solirubrobacter sp.]
MTQLPGPLVNADWLAEHLHAPDLRVLEATVHLTPRDGGYDVRSGREDWAAGHIPGSAFADLIEELSQPHESLNFTFPPPGRFGDAMSALGVEDGTAVVVYDRNDTMWATRLWWLLHAYGFDAAVLDGGLAAWHGELTDAPAPEHDATFTPRPHPRTIADRAEVENGPACLLNALSPEAFREARIPGSTNLAGRDLLDPDSGRFRSPEELRRRLGAAGALGGGRVVTYCGGGISATLDAFVLTLLGEPDVAVYDGSMGEWLADPARPIERG